MKEKSIEYFIKKAREIPYDVIPSIRTYVDERMKEEDWNTEVDNILTKLSVLWMSFGRKLPFKKIPVFVNGDPRGYALKIDDSYVKKFNLKIERDWGGYGIIAPDFK